MKNVALAAVACAVLVLTTACSAQTGLQRTVSVIIPSHPWEAQGHSMWYSLVYNTANETRTVFVENNVREVTLKVPAGQTVYVCAYPLGSLKPFGAGIDPQIDAGVFVLDQDQGVLADLMLRMQEPMVNRVNYKRLYEYCAAEADDFTFLDTQTLVQDVYNGNLGKNSIRTKPGIEVSDLEFYPGLWIAESVHCSSFSVGNDGKTPSFLLAEGVHRYLCPERGIEIRIVVSEDGVYKYERPTEMV